jgi:hypothetical protein
MQAASVQAQVLEWDGVVVEEGGEGHAARAGKPASC